MTISSSETDNVIDDLSDNKSAITVYIRNINTMSKSTAVEYLLRLNNFEKYVAKEYDGHLTINDLIAKIKNGMLDPYSVLNGYAAYLRNCNITTSTLKQRIVTVG